MYDFKLLNLFTDSSPHDYKSSLTSVYTASPVDESTVWQELLPLDMLGNSGLSIQPWFSLLTSL